MAYTTDMSMFVSATESRAPKTKNSGMISLLYAAIIVILLVAQLFTYEDLPALIGGLGLLGGEACGPTTAVVLVVLELLALPFLLRMRLSPAFRVVSMAAGWLTAGTLLFLTIWETAVHTSNSVLLGATVPLPVGAWNVCVSLALCVLAAWASWGLWPLGPTRKK